MKRITINEEIYNRFKELCSTNKSTQANMLEILIDSYANVECVRWTDSEARIASLEIELLELRNQLIS